MCTVCIHVHVDGNAKAQLGDLKRLWNENKEMCRCHFSICDGGSCPQPLIKPLCRSPAADGLFTKIGRILDTYGPNISKHIQHIPFSKGHVQILTDVL